MAGRLADGEQQHHSFGVQAARHEPQHHHRFGIQPLHVVDHAHQRHLRRHLGQQRQHRQRDQEPVRRRPGHQPERAAQRVPLRPRQPLQLIGEREQEPVQPGITQLRLRLHPGQPGGLQASRRRGGDRLVQQRGLADPGLAAQHQGAAVALGGPGQQAAERLAFGRTADQHHVHTLPPGARGNVPHLTPDAATLPGHIGPAPAGDVAAPGSACPGII